MSEADEDAAGDAKARRLREEIARLRSPADPGAAGSTPRPVSTREFTDAAAAGRPSRKANLPEESASDSETERGVGGATDRAE